MTKLLNDHDPEVVRVYLHVFQLQRPEGWAALNELVAETPELQFGSEEAPAKEEPVKEAAVKEEPAAEAEEPVEEADADADADAEEPVEDVSAEEK